MLLPSASHNTPEGREKLRREADLETRAGLDKIKLQEENKKRLHQQTLERNIKKLQSSLSAKVFKLQFIKREIVGLKNKQQEAENKDRSLIQEEILTAGKLVTIDQNISKLETEQRQVTTDIVHDQNKIRTEASDKMIKQSESFKTQKLIREKNRELVALKNELVNKTDLDKSNKAKVKFTQKEITIKEEVFKQNNSVNTALENESRKNKKDLVEVRREVSNLKKQLQIKEKELDTLESISRTLEDKTRNEIQRVKKEESNLDKLNINLREEKFFTEQSSRAVGYLERKINDASNDIKTLTMHTDTGSTSSLPKSESFLRKLEVANKKASDIKNELVKIILTKENVEHQIKNTHYLATIISNEMKGFVSKIRRLEYDHNKLEKETKAIVSEIEKIESELR